MARRSVLLDPWGQTLQITVPAAELLLSDKIVDHALSHYDGDLADANVYRITREYVEKHDGRAAIHRLSVLIGLDALGPVIEPPAVHENGHVPTGTSPHCSRCGLHVTAWDTKACAGLDAHVVAFPGRHSTRA